MNATLLQKTLLQFFNDNLLAWSRSSDAPRILLAEPPWRASPEITVTHQPSMALREPRQSSGYLHLMRWEKEALHASRFPYMGFVLEGEADIRIGTTAAMLAKSPALRDACGCYVLSLPAQTFFVIPPGVPYSDGSRPHWERPGLEHARSRILWLNVLPEATLCHTCATQGEKHASQSALTVGDAQLMTLADLLIAELRGQSRHHEAVARGLLTTFLLRVERGLAAPRVPSVGRPGQYFGFAPVADPTSNSKVLPAMTIHRACRYIEANLREPLTPALIAAHAFVSPSQLKRTFRAELNTTIMRWVTERRIEAARSLLENTDVPVNEVARHLGYAHPSHFSLVFTQLTGVSPRGFRQQRYAAPTKRKKKPAAEN